MCVVKKKLWDIETASMQVKEKYFAPFRHNREELRTYTC
jgi:hypothetical protein